MSSSSDLIYFPDAEIEFRAVHYSSKEDFSLELGDEFIDETDEMTDEEIKDWADGNGYFDDENNYIDEDGVIDYDRLREHKKIQEEDYPVNDSYPSGRAFDWFSKLGFDFPSEIKISIIDGDSPGRDWRGVVVDDYNSLKLLQDYLFSKSVKINFIIDFDI
jgi:hypothetical protein